MKIVVNIHKFMNKSTKTLFGDYVTQAKVLGGSITVILIATLFRK